MVRSVSAMKAAVLWRSSKQSLNFLISIDVLVKATSCAFWFDVSEKAIQLIGRRLFMVLSGAIVSTLILKPVGPSGTGMNPSHTDQADCKFLEITKR
ncbi:hypothetical protein PoB_003799400 [Plakobranchus ocellatus]|uniref:Uncharacterized protein n=1 Tax=Plakobranchus ocellatus TaxID=259542 RepID=A0AAV4AZH3_9GAST|nr:hypothetical protein PoB_003799400 [Plakobranchus ocellatus]